MKLNYFCICSVNNVKSTDRFIISQKFHELESVPLPKYLTLQVNRLEKACVIKVIVTEYSTTLENVTQNVFVFSRASSVALGLTMSVGRSVTLVQTKYLLGGFP